LVVAVASVNNSFVTAVAVGDNTNVNELVCPSDYLVLKSSIDNENINSNGEKVEEEMAKRRRRLAAVQASSTTTATTTTIQPVKVTTIQPVKVVRQSESYVEFTIQNTTWFHSSIEQGPVPLPDHIFTTML